VKGEGSALKKGKRGSETRRVAETCKETKKKGLGDRTHSLLHGNDLRVVEVEI